MERGQVTLEMAVALVAAFFLLFGSLMIFGWLNTRLVFRQERYEGHPAYGRVAAGMQEDEVLPTEDAGLMNVFGIWE